MRNLLEKIEAHAAQRLVLPQNRAPSSELARYKNFLKVERHRLKMQHRAGAGGRAVCQGQAAVLDVLLRYLLDAVRNSAPLDASARRVTFALVALGGYGRGELNPQSDIDIMFLHSGELVFNGKPRPYLSALTDGLLYTLWDIGLKVGHSVRSVDDCARIANTDMQSKTSLIEARLIAGDEELFQRMQAVVLAKCVRGSEASYIKARIEDQEARRAKFGNSATMQEPNIKNGCGGLRDFQNLVWMSFFKYRVRTLREMETRELIGAGESKQLEAAYDFLLRTRNELHYQTNRPVDALSRSLQPVVAHHLGYTDRSPSKRLQRFMRDLYSHMRNIYLITRTVEQRLALLPQPQRLPSLRQIIRSGRQRALQQLFDGFKLIDREIHAATPRVFRDQPRRLMRVFLYAQQRGFTLHPDLTQLVRNHLSLAGKTFLQDRHVHETFLEILNQRGNVAPILRAMHDVGLLGRYLPEFGRLTCLVQHEFYHRYTADEHTLMCLEKLDQVWEAKQPPFNRYTEIFQRIERPFVLYLALLLHDAGKAYDDGKHEVLGGKLTLNVSRRLGLDSATTHALRLLVEQHLAMIQISLRRDLDDPVVIRNFAALVQSPENLDMLLLHTFADSLGTSEQLWNGFKDTLLSTLYHKTMNLLSGGTDFLRAEEKHRELLAAEVRKLMSSHLGEDELQAHFAHLPARYFQIHSARQIMADLDREQRFLQLQMHEEDKALEPVIDWHNEPDRGYTAVHVCTWDRARLFSKITGCLTAAGLNILSAQIFSRTDGIILDTFFVTDAKTGLLPVREEREKFERFLKTALTGHLDLSPLIARQKVTVPIYRALEGEQIPTVLHFDNDTSDYYTVIDIQTEDRVGLLYIISQALADLSLDIALAKICTEKGAAIDSFYVSQADSRKVTSPEYQKFISDKLKAAIASLDPS
ncbi:MAG: [protein-PII] uridylyltransferase [Verrucomicrobia bacterium]|nr:[protein-PII] uridylyltransferase [Verrucomicrobiota bacterium]